MWGIWTGITLSGALLRSPDSPQWSHVIVQVSGNFFFFFLAYWKPKLPCPACLSSIGEDWQFQRCDWADGGHVRARQNQTTPLSLNSFVCNWYRAWRKKKQTAETSVFRGREAKKLPRGPLLRWVCQTAVEQRNDSACFFGQVTTL